MAILDSTDSSFNEDLVTKGLVMVDFWAEWCGNCKTLMPTIEEVSIERSDTLKVLKMNVEENPMIPTKYAVRGLPTILLFKNGEQIDSKVGSVSKSTLLEWVDSHA